MMEGDKRTEDKSSEEWKRLVGRALPKFFESVRKSYVPRRKSALDKYLVYRVWDRAG